MPPHCAVSIIIPAYNEADRIGDTVAAVLRFAGVREVVVVDDGSPDGTAQVATDAGASSVLVNEKNLGKGRSLMRGVEASSGGVLLFLDADLGDTASAAEALLPPVVSGDADMTIAVLPAAKKKGGFGFVLRTAAWGIRKCTGFEARAPISGQRAIRRKLLDELGGLADGYGIEFALTIDALHHGFRIQEVDVPFEHRETGRDLAGFMHRAKQLRQIARALAPRLIRAKRLPSGSSGR